MGHGWERKGPYERIEQARCMTNRMFNKKKRRGMKDFSEEGEANHKTRIFIGDSIGTVKKGYYNHSLKEKQDYTNEDGKAGQLNPNSDLMSLLKLHE